MKNEELKYDDFGRPLRKNVFIDKGVVLTEQYISDNKKIIEKYLDFWIAYPDCFLNLITPRDSTFRLYFYQCLMLRAAMRFRYVFGTFTRAYSKSFIAILANILKCIFLPNTKSFVCADIKASGVRIAKEKIQEIFNIWPLLEKEVASIKQSNDYVEVLFKNGSMFDVVGVTVGTRGKLEKICGGKSYKKNMINL